MKPIAYSKMKKQVADRAALLTQLAQSLKLDFRKMTSKEKTSSKKERDKAAIRLQQQTLLLERDWEELQMCEASNYMDPSWWNSFYPFFALFLSVLSFIISLLWFIQICIYLLPSAWGGKPIHPFLISWLELLVSKASERAAREWSTVVKISIPPSTLFHCHLSRISSILKHTNKSFLTCINIFEHLFTTLSFSCYKIYFFHFNVKFFIRMDSFRCLLLLRLQFLFCIC